MKPRELTDKLLEADDVPPESYINKLPDVFDANEVLTRIHAECSYEMDFPNEKREFMEWIKANENLFPDVAKALTVIRHNDYWDTDNDDDMLAFFERLGFKQDDDTCQRCDGSGEEPGAPVDWEEHYTRCERCNGTGKILLHCECDETNRANDSVCGWCRARGRNRFHDPAV